MAVYLLFPFVAHTKGLYAYKRVALRIQNLKNIAVFVIHLMYFTKYTL
jgi:hypothetical protein